jgi:uncharacterized membrane protein YsdA (DUF1294 family)
LTKINTSICVFHHKTEKSKFNLVRRSPYRGCSVLSAHLHFTV